MGWGAPLVACSGCAWHRPESFCAVVCMAAYVAQSSSPDTPSAYFVTPVQEKAPWRFWPVGFFCERHPMERESARARFTIQWRNWGTLSTVRASVFLQHARARAFQVFNDRPEREV